MIHLGRAKERLMQRFQLLVSLIALFAASSCGADPIEVDAREVFEHQPVEYLRLHGIPADEAEPFGANLILSVNKEGRISKACVETYRETNSCRSLDARYFQSIRYRPFLRDGKAVPVTLRTWAVLYPEERRPTRTVPFPPTDLSTLNIKLSRGSCFGTCPVYDVSIDGAGNVVWQGDLYSMLDGEYRAQIPVSAVKKIVNMFAAADFYSLDNEYKAAVTDSATNTITISMGGRSKTVIDYVGLSAGMPKSVFDLEEAIDAAAGTDRWVLGTPETVEILKKQRFNFASQHARKMLLQAVDRPAFLRALISAGVPVEPNRNEGKDEPVINVLVSAIALGNREAIRILIEAGAAKDLTPAEAGEMLQAAGKNVDPRLIKMVLALAPKSSFLPEAKVEALKLAIEYNFQMVGSESRSYFDKPGAVATMLDAGIDTNRLDKNSETVLAQISDPERAAQLIAAGANPNQRNKKGEIPLLSNHNDETTLYLMKVTRPGIADPAIVNALMDRAIRFKFTKVIAKLQADRMYFASRK